MGQGARVNVTDLSEAWNNLRNAALGRGTTPHVSPGLADTVGMQYERWRAYYAASGPLDDVFTSYSASEWLAIYRKLVADVRAEGVKVEALPRAPWEKITDSAATLGQVVGGLVFFGVAATALALVLGKRSR
jgi:hypothetical protein